MLYVLLFVGIAGQTPAQLGSFESMAQCQQAIREVYLQQNTPRGIDITPEFRQTINQVVDVKMKYQREYVCQTRSK